MKNVGVPKAFQKKPRPRSNRPWGTLNGYKIRLTRKAGLHFGSELDAGNEALVFMRSGTLSVDHFELGPEVKGSAYYDENPPPKRLLPPVEPDNSAGSYYECSIGPGHGGTFDGAGYRVWIPAGVSRLKGLIVRQHGSGANGKRFANDLQFQALAAKTLKILGYKAPVALRLSDEIIDAQVDKPMPDAVDIELNRLAEVFSTEDALEGLSSLGRKRPEYKGK